MGNNMQAHPIYHYKAILKKMSVGGNPSCCNLEALLEKFFSGFLEIYQNIF